MHVVQPYAHLNISVAHFIIQRTHIYLTICRQILDHSSKRNITRNTSAVDILLQLQSPKQGLFLSMVSPGKLSLRSWHLEEMSYQLNKIDENTENL